MDIDGLRKKIDELDIKILELINKRAVLALDIGGLKKARGLPIASPEREEKVLAEIRKRNPGPLDDEAISGVYKKIIEETRELQMDSVK